MDLLQTIIATLIAFGILVGVHEYGHYLVARWCGVRVLRFSWGFGPVLFARKSRSGTEFTISALPLGGYVQMLDEREQQVPAAELHTCFNSKPPWQRIAIALGGPLANFLLAIFAYWIMFMSGTMMLVPVIGPADADSVISRAGVPAGMEIVQVDGERTLSWSQVHLALVKRLGDDGSIALTLRRPELTNSLDGSELRQYHLPIHHWLAEEQDPNVIIALGLEPITPALIGIVAAGSSAERAGLVPGDHVLSVNGTPISSWQQWTQMVRDAPQTPLTLRILRQGKEHLLTLTPESRGDAAASIGYAGTGSLHRIVQAPPGQALQEALTETGTMTLLTLNALQKMLTGLISPKNLSGPITIARITGDAVASGLEASLRILALLSISLGVLNLLPIPVLDGGSIMLHLAEWLKGSPVSERVQSLGIRVGVLVVFCLMALAIGNDLGRLL